MTDAPLIRLTDITKHYQMGDMEVRALDGVSMEIRRGSTWPSWAPPVRESPR